MILFFGPVSLLESLFPQITTYTDPTFALAIAAVPIAAMVASTSAPHRRLPAAACTACAATTPP